MSSGIYNHFKAQVLSGAHNLATGGNTITVALMKTGHSFTATNNHWADVSSNVLTAASYAAKNLGNKAVTQAATTKFDADDSVWGTATFTAYHAVLYDNTHADDGLICSFDFGTAKTVSAGTFTLAYHSDGILTLA